MRIDLVELETELKRRVAEPRTPWRTKQNDRDDRATQFIYDIRKWEDLKRRVQGLDRRLRDYAINRWFNFWSARGVG